jgi:hypothetical protein
VEADGALLRILRAMGRHLDDAYLHEYFIRLLNRLCLGRDANAVTLVDAGAHLSMLRVMDRHQDNGEVVGLACHRLCCSRAA